MVIPSSVYRLQLNAEFPLKKAIAILPYLHKIGIDGIYTSPIFKAGQLHGYDITDPLHINPLIGNEEEFETFISIIQEYGMAFVLDIIPNHMGTQNNLWWNDVLEKGIESSFVDFFDIDWSPEKPQLNNKVLLPFLHDFYGRVLQAKMIKLIWDQEFWITYQNLRFPISIFTFPDIIKINSDEKHFSHKESQAWLECLTISESITKLALEKKRQEKIDEQKKSLQNLYQRSPFIQKQIRTILEKINQNPEYLHNILEKQYYRLSYWAVAGQEINYRRFFNINELACIHIEKKSVLDRHHRWIFYLIETKKVNGLRIDHPDGLYDPKEYLDRLQSKNPSFIVLEKILAFRERLPESWNVQGTVGYDFLNMLNGIYIEKKNEKRLNDIYEAFIGQTTDFEELLYERKKWFMIQQMASEINALGWRLDQLTENSKDYRDFTRIDLTRALKEIIACFPVYRTYVTLDGNCLKQDQDYIVRAIEKAQLKTPDIDPSVYAYIRDLLLGKWKDDKLMDFVLRFQQLTGPVMAKGLEDSCFYIYNRLISLNEVGGNPQNFGVLKSEFHNFNQEKFERWPLGFLTSSTHDTKCSEDVRFRINVLSEIPDQWEKVVNYWQSINQKYKKLWHGLLFPDANTEFYLYQMLLGLWPIDKERLWKCLHKAVREAGIYTSWRWPNLEYENILQDFMNAILASHTENAFLPSFQEFHKTIAHYGNWNSLAALILKMGSCGIVDIYQGNEWENLRMMDPDNRELVDYEKRISCLEKKPHLSELFLQEEQGPLKFWITLYCLQLRRSHKDLFLKGSYTPLKIQGVYHEEVIAFLRSYENQHALIATGCYFTHLSSLPLGKSWENTCIVIPQKLFENKNFSDIFTNNLFPLHKSGKDYQVPLVSLFQNLPFSISISNKM